MVGHTDILEFLARRPGGAEAVTINDHLKGRFLVQTRLLLHGMVGEGLLKTQKRRVEGNRLAIFFRITARGRERLQADTFTTHTNHCRELTVA